MLEYNHEKNEDMIYTELLIKILFEPILERLRDQMKIKKDSKKNTLKTKQEIRKLEKLRAQLNDESKKDLDEEIQKRLEELEQRIIEEQKIYRSLKLEAASEIEDIEAKICKLSKDIEEVDTIKLSSSLRVWGNHYYFVLGPEPFTCRKVLRMRKIKQQWKESLGLISFEDVPQHNQLGGNVISAAESMKAS